MSNRTLLLLPLLLALAACTAPRDPEAVGAPDADATAPAAPPPATPAPPADTTPPATEPPAMASCDADAANTFIGQTASAGLVEQARVAAGAAIARTLAPGQVVTMEFRGDRLNLMVDDTNVVTGVRCG